MRNLLKINIVKMTIIGRKIAYLDTKLAQNVICKFIPAFRI